MDKKYRENPLDPEKWALLDKQTGSVKEIKHKLVKEVIPTNQVSVHYQNYFSLDTDRLQVLLSNGIKDIELGLLIIISSNLHSFYNICRGADGTPHTTRSISKILGQTVQATKKKLNRLIQLEVLAHEIVPMQKQLGKVYIVNPFIIKRGRAFDEFLDKLFFDIVKTDNKQSAEIKNLESQNQSIQTTDQSSLEPES